jgi:hypothetical protein
MRLAVIESAPPAAGRRAGRQVCVVVARDADEHAHGSPGQAVGRVPAALQRLPRQLEQKPLLGVDAARLAR